MFFNSFHNLKHLKGTPACLAPGDCLRLVAQRRRATREKPGLLRLRGRGARLCFGSKLGNLDVHTISTARHAVMDDKVAEAVSAQQVHLSEECFASVGDSHCHPQDDASNHQKILDVKSKHVAVMGVREDDWERVEHLHQLAPSKVGATEQPHTLPCRASRLFRSLALQLCQGMVIRIGSRVSFYLASAAGTRQPHRLSEVSKIATMIALYSLLIMLSSYDDGNCVQPLRIQPHVRNLLSYHLELTCRKVY